MNLISRSPVLDRPLIYTAVTRARTRVEVWGGEESLVAAIRRVPERNSGLRERLGVSQEHGAQLHIAGSLFVPGRSEV